MKNQQLLVSNISVFYPDSPHIDVPQRFHLLHTDSTARIFETPGTQLMNNENVTIRLVLYPTNYNGTYIGPSEAQEWITYVSNPSVSKILCDNSQQETPQPATAPANDDAFYVIPPLSYDEKEIPITTVMSSLQSNNDMAFNKPERFTPVPKELIFSQKVLDIIGQSYLFVIPTYDLRFVLLNPTSQNIISLMATALNTAINGFMPDRYDPSTSYQQVLERIANFSSLSGATMRSYSGFGASFTIRSKLVAVQHFNPFIPFLSRDTVVPPTIYNLDFSITKTLPFDNATNFSSTLDVPMSLLMYRQMSSFVHRGNNNGLINLFNDCICAAWNVIALNSGEQLTALPHSWSLNSRGYIRSQTLNPDLIGPDGFMVQYQANNYTEYYITKCGATAYGNNKVYAAYSAEKYNPANGTINLSPGANATSVNRLSLARMTPEWCRGAKIIMEQRTNSNGSLQYNISRAYGVPIMPCDGESKYSVQPAINKVKISVNGYQWASRKEFEASVAEGLDIPCVKCLSCCVRCCSCCLSE